MDDLWSNFYPILDLRIGKKDNFTGLIVKILFVSIGCEVFAFDHTIKRLPSTKNSGKIHWKPIGLGVENSEKLKTLGILIAENDHTNRIIQYLKVRGMTRGHSFRRGGVSSPWLSKGSHFWYHFKISIFGWLSLKSSWSPSENQFGRPTPPPPEKLLDRPLSNYESVNRKKVKIDWKIIDWSKKRENLLVTFHFNCISRHFFQIIFQNILYTSNDMDPIHFAAYIRCSLRITLQILYNRKIKLKLCGCETTFKKFKLKLSKISNFKIQIETLIG